MLKGVEPLALMGGTFDPVHYGHLRCAEEAREKLQLERLYLLPAGQPPHRGVPGASAGQRLDMLKLALEEFPALDLDDRETRRPGPSYMVETLFEIRVEDPARPLVLLIGQDAANQLHTWYEWRRLFDLAHLVLLTRPGIAAGYHQEVETEIGQRLASEISALSETPSGAVMYLGVTPVEVSATLIKQRLAEGLDPGPMLPEKVLEYIRSNRLYLRHGRL
jgi:nicotinate-nucleotide adenylyltransferase